MRYSPKRIYINPGKVLEDYANEQFMESGDFERAKAEVIRQ